MGIDYLIRLCTIRWFYFTGHVPRTFTIIDPSMQCSAKHLFLNKKSGTNSLICALERFCALALYMVQKHSTYLLTLTGEIYGHDM